MSDSDFSVFFNNIVLSCSKSIICARNFSSVFLKFVIFLFSIKIVESWTFKDVIISSLRKFLSLESALFSEIIDESGIFEGSTISFSRIGLFTLIGCFFWILKFSNCFSKSLIFKLRSKIIFRVFFLIFFLNWV